MSNELKGEKKFTRQIKDLLEEALKTDDELKQCNYRISCDTDEDKKKVSAVISLNKFLKNYHNKNENLSIKDFTNNEFHPDILIEEEINTGEDVYYIPRLMIESKYLGTSATPHEILAYNYKADLHKKLYSGLRYGLIIGNSKYVQNTTIKFGNNFDFILALGNDISKEEKERLIDVVKRNLTYAKKLESILDKDREKEFLCIGIENNIVFKDEK